MKYFNVSEFALLLKEEIDNFEHYQVSYSPSAEKTIAEWVNSFMVFAGYADEEVEDTVSYEEYDDEYGYMDPHYEELVSRKKIRSYREDSEW